MNSQDKHYRMCLVNTLAEIGEAAWTELLQAQEKPTPFLSYAFLHALHESGSASPATGWRVCYLSIWQEQEQNPTLVAVMPLYEKNHSYGEYVFDWAWANAYHEHGLAYYPKLLSALPFTPVEGTRLLCRDASAQAALIQAAQQLLTTKQYSSLHILFPTQKEIETLQAAGFLIRQGLQFHWKNQNYRDFEDFLESLEKKKRKNIRAERRKVREAGIRFRHIRGKDINKEEWLFFKRCYDQTYHEHRSSPYLNLDFFMRIGQTMPAHLLLILAIRDDIPIAASLLVHDQDT
ncbi:MAG: GNAT family N-acetyltransferase, partial [Burkholderiales bacterium]|nr:GNAT family N-acetyltransferase [Burkholderiales bacterium]